MSKIKTEVVIKKPKIIYDTLKNVIAWAYKDTFFIELDSKKNKSQYEKLDSLIHEMLHLFFPNLSEKEVIKISHYMVNILWEEGFRVRKPTKKKKSRLR